MMYVTRLRPVIENLIVAQRALARAIGAKDANARRSTLAERDRCTRALEEAFQGIEQALAGALAEQDRLKNREINLSAIIIRLHREHPEIVGEGIEAELVRLDVDPRMGEAFLTCLGESIEDGLAVRRGPTDVRITHAGVLQLIAAKRLRHDLDALRTEHFRLEKRLRADEASTTEPSVQRAAAGA